MAILKGKQRVFFSSEMRKTAASIIIKYYSGDKIKEDKMGEMEMMKWGKQHPVCPSISPVIENARHLEIDETVADHTWQLHLIN
jgi:hypothetical protein